MILNYYKNWIFLVKSGVENKITVLPLNNNNYLYSLNLFITNINISLNNWFLYYYSNNIFQFNKYISYNFIIIKPLLVVFFIDFILESDEPIFEPIEWTFIQTWLLIFFIFSWIVENLILSRFGSFSNHDKKIWFSWFKTLIIIEFFFIITLFVIIYLIILPFYFELTYNVFFIILWWNWISKFFLFKILNYLIIINFIILYIQLTLKFSFFNKLLFLITLVIILLLNMFFVQFYLTFYMFLSDKIWYIKNKYNTMIKLSFEPLKWGWDFENRDHFQYHNTKINFWFKNDNPFAESIFLLNFFFLLFIITTLFFWVTLFKKTITLLEISYTYTIMTFSMIKYLFYFIFGYILILVINFVIIFMKIPFEFLFFIDKQSFLYHLVF